jgi:non-specific serine/threonine protein kinase
VLLEYDAVRLFIERAHQVNPDFNLNRRNVEAITDICGQLDGIPLAIEMAAARIKSLSAAEVRQRLDDRFRLLASGNRAALPRHQTLRAAIEWSNDLLTAAERTLLWRLSVFAGGWTLEGAEEVAGGSRETSEMLSALTDKSLITHQAQEGGSRYGMLETIRQYGREQLEACGEALEVRRRHLDYCLRLAEVPEETVLGPQRRVWFSRMDHESNNMRVALDFCEQDEESLPSGLRLATALNPFWKSRLYLSEGRRRCVSLLSHPGAQARTASRAALLLALVNLMNQQSDYEGASALVAEALSIYREIPHREGIARALLEQSRYTEDERERCNLIEESLPLLQEIGDRFGIAQAIAELGGATFLLGEYERSQHLMTQALALYRQLESAVYIAFTLHNRSYQAYLRGEYQTAKTLELESLQLHREVESRVWEVVNLQHLAFVCLDMGEIKEARAYCEAALHLQREVWRKQEFIMALDFCAEIACQDQDFTRAACLWGASTTIRTRYGLLIPRGRPKSLEQWQAQARTAIGEKAFAHAWDRGKVMTLENALHYVLREDETAGDAPSGTVVRPTALC